MRRHTKDKKISISRTFRKPVFNTKKHPRAQIVATIGPATKSVAVITKLIAHHMDVARLNFSHGTYKEHAQYIRNIRNAAKKLNRHIPIIQDLSGPRVTTGSGHKIASKFVTILTEKDMRDLAFGYEQGIDYVAMSYVGSAKDIQNLKDEMKKFGKPKPIIAKIERLVAANENLDVIIKASDGIMIGRGDLANEVPMEHLPFTEKKIIERCNKFHKPVITATQMMLSMVDNPLPTRAEITDVAFAIILGSDAVMLSEETAIGKYPVKAVQIMEKIVLESENHLKQRKINRL